MTLNIIIERFKEIEGGGGNLFIPKLKVLQLEISQTNVQ